MDWLNIDTVSAFVSMAFSHQVTQFGLAFTFAAWLHAGRVKKEIRSQMESMIEAVDKVAAVLKQDLAGQAARLSELTSRVITLETKGDA